WSIGSYWEYKITLTYDEETGLSEVEENLKYTVIGIREDRYELNITGTVTGYGTLLAFGGVPLPYSVEGNIYGSIFYRLSDLAILEKNTIITGNATIALIFKSDYLRITNVSYSPPYEDYDFPLFNNEPWSLKTTIKISGKLVVEDYTDQNFSYDKVKKYNFLCTGIQTKRIGLGNFSTYAIAFNTSDEEKGSKYYSSEVKNIVYESIEGREDVELLSYSLAEQNVEIDEKIEPMVVEKGGSITVYGSAKADNKPLSNTDLIIRICGSTWKTKTNQEGTYSIKLSLPSNQDDTPSNDFASHGVVLELLYFGKNYYNVRTVTLVSFPPPDLYASNLSFSTLHPSVNENVKVTATIGNFGSTSAKDIVVRAYVDGIASSETKIDYLSKDEKKNITFNWQALLGRHEIWIIVDPENFIIESREDNNEVKGIIEVYSVDLYITKIELSNYAPSEGDNIEIHVSIGNRGNMHVIGARVEVEVGTHLVYQELHNLTMNEKKKISFSWQIEFGTYGKTAITAKIDPDNEFHEDDEDNNILIQKISINAVPVAKIVVEKSGSGFIFDGSSSFDKDGKIISYNWDFGDNTTSSDEKVFHAFTMHSTFDVKLKVIDNMGAIGIDTAIIIFTNSKPIAYASYEGSLEVRKSIKLIGLGFDSDGYIEKYEWDFDGDGNYEYSSNKTGVVYHTYNETGVYIANFRVRDNEGAYESAILELPINETIEKQIIKIIKYEKKDDWEKYAIFLLAIAIILLMIEKGIANYFRGKVEFIYRKIRK
ncbi:MAG: CARDB domain-containing protein, partial [Candidatus Thermoplasmatota archaeon]